MGDYYPSLSNHLNHLLIWKQLIPLTVLWFVCRVSSLHYYFFIMLICPFIHVLNKSIKLLFMGSYCNKNHLFLPFPSTT